ncbi:MAG: hypothetical protein ACTHOU_10395, partial [Aureliella sp.]
EGGLDLGLSVQHQLLDSQPPLEVANSVPGGSGSAADSDGRPAAADTLAALCCRTPSAAIAIFVHPSDSTQAE